MWLLRKAIESLITIIIIIDNMYDVLNIISKLTEKTCISKKSETFRDIINYKTCFVIVFISTILLFSSITMPAFADSISFITSFDGKGSNGQGTAFDTASGIAVDANGKIYILDAGTHLMKMYDNSGNFISHFNGIDSSGNGTAFVVPSGIVADDSKIYVLDSNPQSVQVYNNLSKFLVGFDGEGTNNQGTVFTGPIAIAVDDGEIYVTDVGSKLVQVYDNLGNFLVGFDGEGTNNQGTAFIFPQGIAVDSGEIYVLDNNIKSVQVYDNSGNFLRNLNGTDSSGNGTAFVTPIAVVIDADGKIYVSDVGTDLVQVYDEFGKFLVGFDGIGCDGGTKFDFSNRIAVGDDGKIYVLDRINKLVQVYSYDVLPDSCKNKLSDGGSNSNKHKTRPTFGINHQTFTQQVEGGFSFNGIPHDITDNFHTPFAEQEVKVGQTNSFTTKVFADKKLQVVEFLFGIPVIGMAHNAELGIEIHYNYDGDIEKVIVVQKSKIIDVDSVKVSTSESKCSTDDKIPRCVTTHLSMKFLEPLQHKIMAIKAIDYKKRVQTTYLNEGFDITGNPLTPPQTDYMPSGRDGLVQMVRFDKFENLWTISDEIDVEKFGNLWVSPNAIIYTRNDVGSWFRLSPQNTVEQNDSAGNVMTRLHSEFSTYKAYQADEAQITLDELCMHCKDTPFDKIPTPFESKLDDPKIQSLLVFENKRAHEYLDKSYEKWHASNH